MLSALKRYAHWLHLGWPAGKVERLPVVQELGRTNVAGLYIVGDLSGIPLLKMSLETGVQAVRDLQGQLPEREGDIDVCIIGGGVSGVAAAIEAHKQGLNYVLLESNQLFSTIANFPKKKPIFTYPTEMTPSSDLQVSADVKEDLLTELKEQVERSGINTTPGYATHVERKGKGLHVIVKDGEPIKAKGVIIAIGRSGNFRRMGIPGEDLDKVSNRLHDPAKHKGQKLVVVGGGDSACEAAIAIAEQNPPGEPLVTLVYRGENLSRPKPENVARVEALAAAGQIDLRLKTNPKAVTGDSITLASKGAEPETIPNEYVLSLIGREPPLEFFRRSGVQIRGERTWAQRAPLITFLLIISIMYGMKAFGWFGEMSWNPLTWARAEFSELQTAGADKGLWYTIVASFANGFGPYIALLYCTVVVVFGIRRIRRRKTPYITLQTTTLMLIQCLPLFILPEIVLPYIGHQGAFDSGFGATMANNLFPEAGYDNNGREYWRAYGFILAWPLFVWNVFTGAPNTWWLVISLLQTFVIIPLIIWRWGKGAYCGWICSCGALAETLGDTHREKMPHGPGWNKLNFVGQAILVFAFALLIMHVIGWITGSTGAKQSASLALNAGWKPAVDWLLAGAVGTGLYFWFSGRTWCRFACPLAALMHIYARFTRFRIVVDSKKCISCNACTTVCHQGIDIMNFANKGKHMADVECVRCSACVQTCPTGVLQFGRVDKDGVTVVATDSLAASPVLMREEADKT